MSRKKNKSLSSSPPYEPRQVLDPEHPMSIGAMVGPEVFTEVRYLAHHKQKQALELIPQVQKEFEKIFGRQSGGLIHTYHCDDADTIIVALGSVVGTLKDVVDERRAQGKKIGVLSICSFRPFPFEAVGNALKNAKTIISFEKAFQVGIGGIVSSHIFHSLRDIDPDLHPDLYEVIAGLGGRNITKHSIHDMLDSAQKNELEPLTFLDLDRTLVEAELERQETVRRSGPMAENMLRDVNTRANQAANARNN